MPWPSRTCALGASSKAAYYSLAACYLKTFWQPCKILWKNLRIRVRYIKCLATESKAFQGRSNSKVPARLGEKNRLSRSKLKQAFLIDSDAELFMYLIQCIGFCSWKVRCLNRALEFLTCFFRSRWDYCWLCGWPMPIRELLPVSSPQD